MIKLKNAEHIQYGYSRNSHILLAEMYNEELPLNTMYDILQIYTFCSSAILLTDMDPKEMKTFAHKLS